MSRLLAALPVALCCASCASGPRQAARFTGKELPPLVTAEQVRIVESLPADAKPTGAVRASCTLTEGRSRIDDEWLSDVDCTVGRLTWAMREAAASVGGTLIAERRCHSDVVGASDSERTLKIACFAQVGRARGATRVARAHGDNPPGLDPELALRADEPNASDAWRIRVDFEPVDPPWRATAHRPVSKQIPTRPLRGDQVEEQSSLPVGRIALGDVIARCSEGCALASVRAGVRIAAGRMGASDVVGTRCVRGEQGVMCTGTAASYERAPEFDPRFP